MENATEGFNRQLRKATKGKSVLFTDDRLLNMLCLIMRNSAKKQNGRQQD